jgi:hypothetical protein
MKGPRVGGCRDVNLRNFVVVHARSTLQRPRSPWTLQRPCCVVHYRGGALAGTSATMDAVAKSTQGPHKVHFSPKNMDLSVFQQESWETSIHIFTAYC